jgi:hypothetical protein
VKLDKDNNDNNSYVIHVGIVGQIEYLTELLRKKRMQEAKTTSNRRSTTNSNATVAATPLVRIFLISFHVQQWIRKGCFKEQLFFSEETTNS